jgi:polyferredoxin
VTPAAELVIGETVVLVLNGWRCPFTGVAARYTDDRRDNFDIFLPAWLARHNKLIFGWLFVAALLFTFLRWLYWPV